MDKQALRERVWDALEETGQARFPFPPHGRIPNFAGAADAADRLTGLDAWQAADVIKANPDAPQLPVRRAALRAGKTLYMAVPRLRDTACFYRLDPDTIDDIDHATTVGGSAEVGEQVRPAGMAPVDLIVAGSVAVTAAGARVGKGEGYSDLEFAILREAGFVEDATPTVTTVHELQVVDETVSTSPVDVPMDRIVTPERGLRTDAGSKPAGVDWNRLSAERLDEIPILRALRSNE